MSASTILCSLLLAAPVPGEAWQPCAGDRVCVPGTSMCKVPECDSDLSCLEVGDATMCVPPCKTDVDCLGYVPAAPPTDAGPQCFEGVCVVQCGGQCPDEAMECAPLYDDEGVCVWDDAP